DVVGLGGSRRHGGVRIFEVLLEEPAFELDVLVVAVGPQPLVPLLGVLLLQGLFVDDHCRPRWLARGRKVFVAAAAESSGTRKKQPPRAPQVWPMSPWARHSRRRWRVSALSSGVRISTLARRPSTEEDEDGCGE